MIQNNIEMAILVKDRSVIEYAHNGQTFVEGREGSEYEIMIRNPNPFRIEAVVSVDGLSVLDGKTASDHSRGYIVEAHGVLRVPGWKLDETQVARFEFGGKKSSYASQMSGGDTRNTGVIGMLAYKEYVAKPWPRAYIGVGASGLGGVYRGLSSTGMSYNSAPADPWPQNISTSASASASASSYSKSKSKSVASIDNDDVLRSVSVQQNLGTGFGRAEGFATITTSFHRADLLVLMVIYYDNARGLKNRGIEIYRTARPVRNGEPDPFPGMARGCEPPPGWKG